MAGDPGSEARYAATVQRVYENDDLQLTWEPSFCIHWAACIRGSEEAFDPQRRPWVNLDAETPERIAEIVERCPTGALHVIHKDGRSAEHPPEVPEFVPTLDGPTFVRGRIRLFDRAGNLIREDTRVALCRCGESRNKPFCDDSHYRTGFKSEDPNLGEPSEDPDFWPEG